MNQPQSMMLLGGLIVGVTLVCLVLIIGAFLYYRRDRLLTHTERLKAMELGREFPGDPVASRIKAAMGGDAPTGGPTGLASQCYSTTGWVSVGGFGVAFMAMSPQAPGVSYAIAAAAGAVGVTGMICGTILAAKAPRDSFEPHPASPAPLKPRFDPEAV